MYKKYPLDPEYLQKINSIDSFKLAIVGRDPYPTEPINIHFIKHTWNGLDCNSAGRYVVRSLCGTISEIKYGYPLCFAFYLLDCGVVLLNSSYHYLNKETIRNKRHKIFIDDAYSVNKIIFKKSKIILLCGDATSMLALVCPQLDSKIFIPVIHPTPQSKGRGDDIAWTLCANKDVASSRRDKWSIHDQSRSEF
jgi:uracil DNA glycosylase